MAIYKCGHLYSSNEAIEGPAIRDVFLPSWLTDAFTEFKEIYITYQNMGDLAYISLCVDGSITRTVEFIQSHKEMIVLVDFSGDILYGIEIIGASILTENRTEDWIKVADTVYDPIDTVEL